MRGIKLRLYPDRKTIHILNEFFGSARWIYNQALYLKKKQYEETKTSLNIFEISKMITFWKKTDERKWLGLSPRSMLEQELKHLDSAYQKFFKGGGFPGFKKKLGLKSFSIYSPHTRISDNKIKLPKLGWIKIRGMRKFEGKIKTVTVSQTPDGRYYASYCIDDIIEQPKREIKSQIGIDVGVKDFAVLSNGEVIKNEKFHLKYDRKIAYMQRRMSKAVRGSKRYAKWNLRKNVLRCKQNDLKKDFLHKLTHKLVKSHDLIVCEKLNVKQMLETKKMSRSIAGVSWYEFTRQLEYKSAWYGCTYIQVDPYNTSRMCSTCGQINENLILADRKWICECGKELDRDLNASYNILNKGLDKVLKSRREINNSSLDEAIK